jgi:hypothetical protein
MGMPELPDFIGKQTIDIDGRASYYSSCLVKNIAKK